MPMVMAVDVRCVVGAQDAAHLNAQLERIRRALSILPHSGVRITCEQVHPSTATVCELCGSALASATDLHIHCATGGARHYCSASCHAISRRVPQ